MVMRAAAPRRRPAVHGSVVRLGVWAGLAGFALIGGVALAAGVSLETAAVRALVASGVLGGIAAAGGSILVAGVPQQPSHSASPPRLRGRLVDIALPEEHGR